jgi:hypothetical protein
MQKVLWIQNSGYPEFVGGASLSDHYWIEAINADVYRVGMPRPNLDEYDHFVLSNTRLMDPSILNEVSKRDYTLVLHGTMEPMPFEGAIENAVRTVFMSPSPVRS